MDRVNQNSCFAIAAFAVIFGEVDRVLLCHRRDMDLWNLPGDGVESGEISTETIIREVKEETGLDVAIEKSTASMANSTKTNWCSHSSVELLAEN